MQSIDEKRIKQVKRFVSERKMLSFFLGSVFVYFVFTWLTSGAVQDSTTHFVENQSFDVNILARGELKPAQVYSIKSKISGRNSKLIWISPEGEFVNKGQVIARFDKTEYSEQFTTAEQQVSDAAASFEQAKKSLQIQEEVAKKTGENAKVELELAILKSKDILEGSGILLKERLELELSQAKRTYEIALEELADYDLLLEKGHVSKRERAKVADTNRQLFELNKLKEKELINFEKYEWPKLKREAEIAREKAEAEYQRVLRVSAIELQNYKNNVIKFARDLERAEKKLLAVKSNLENCDVFAPVSGQVFYTKLSKGNGERKIQVGDNVWSGQSFMEIPDNNQLIFEANIREFDLSRIKQGQNATIKLDAFSNREVEAKVKMISSLANESGNAKINRFSVVLTIPEVIESAHAGMYGQAQINVASIVNEMAIPVNFVKTDGKQSWVWLDEDYQQKQIVEVGYRNHKWSQIKSGLSHRDIIYL